MDGRFSGGRAGVADCPGDAAIPVRAGNSGRDPNVDRTRPNVRIGPRLGPDIPWSATREQRSTLDIARGQPTDAQPRTRLVAVHQHNHRHCTGNWSPA
jgi:hypothetical protein